jgi:hypothetical protein
MIPAPSRARVAALAAFVAAGVLIPLSTASASVHQSVRLNGDWAPFNQRVGLPDGSGQLVRRRAQRRSRPVELLALCDHQAPRSLMRHR